MRISIITACFNSEDTIEDTLMSVVSQTYPYVEHIVIDGGSTDGTLSAINRHRDRLSVVVSEKDAGVYDAMNKGLQYATGEVIGFLNSDDVYASTDVLERVAMVFRDPDVDGCYADLVYVDRHDRQRIVRYWRSRLFEPGLFSRGWMPAHPTFFVRKAIYEKYGGFDLQFRLQSDFDLTMRFQEVHRIRSVYIPEILVRMRMGGMTNRSIANVVRGNLEAYRACRKNGLDVSPFFIIRKILSRLPQYFRRT